MAPISLLSESLFQIDGIGPWIEVSDRAGTLLVLTLGITGIQEEESLEVSVWGSDGGINWGPKPLAAFPPKSYCGLYSMLLNLSGKPDVRLLRVQWRLIPWRKGLRTSRMCEFYVKADESGARLLPRISVSNLLTAANG